MSYRFTRYSTLGSVNKQDRDCRLLVKSSELESRKATNHTGRDWATFPSGGKRPHVCWASSLTGGKGSDQRILSPLPFGAGTDEAKVPGTPLCCQVPPRPGAKGLPARSAPGTEANWFSFLRSREDMFWPPEAHGVSQQRLSSSTELRVCVTWHSPIFRQPWSEIQSISPINSKVELWFPVCLPASGISQGEKAVATSHCQSHPSLLKDTSNSNRYCS